MWQLIFGHCKFQLLIWVQNRCDVIYWIFLKNDRIVPVSTFVLKEKLLCKLLCLVILQFCCRRIKQLRSMHSVSYCFKTIELKFSVELNYSFFIYFIFSCMFCIWMQALASIQILFHIFHCNNCSEMVQSVEDSQLNKKLIYF